MGSVFCFDCPREFDSEWLRVRDLLVCAEGEEKGEEFFSVNSVMERVEIATKALEAKNIFEYNRWYTKEKNNDFLGELIKVNDWMKEYEDKEIEELPENVARFVGVSENFYEVCNIIFKAAESVEYINGVVGGFTEEYAYIIYIGYRFFNDFYEMSKDLPDDVWDRYVRGLEELGMDLTLLRIVRSMYLVM